jgi:RNA polymerase sigma factor (sigma-70 family)
VRPPVRSEKERNRIVEALLPPHPDWTASFIKRHYSRSTVREHFDDLLQIGYEGLIRAADLWVPRSELPKSRTETDYQVPSVPAADRETLFRYLGDEGFFIYAQNFVRNEIADYLRNVGKPFTIPDLAETGTVAQLPLSALDHERFAPSPEDLLIQAEESGLRWLSEAMETLTRREKMVVSAYFGLDRELLELQDIGQLLGVSKQRAHEIKNSALRKVERFIKTKRGDET